MIDRKRTACFTGHRNIPTHHRRQLAELLDRMIEALYRKGVVFYGAGGAYGFDMEAEKAVLRARDRHPDIKLILVLPCRDQDKYWAAENKAVFAEICGMVVAIFDTAISYESGQANIKNTCLNVLKGFMAANLVTVVPQRLYSFCTDLQGTFATDLLYSFTGESPYSLGEMALLVATELSGTASLFNLFFIILFGYCTIKVVFANIKRGGILLCQIAIGSLYLFSVPRGFTDGFYNWIKQVIATCMTAFLQTTILYLGLLTFTQHPLIAVGICLSANEVPRIAQMFGLDTSVRVNMMSINSTVSMGAKAVKMIAKK